MRKPKPEIIFDGSPVFRFSESDWANISKELGGNEVITGTLLDHGWRMQEVRQTLETAITFWRLLAPNKKAATIVYIRQITAAIDVLEEAQRTVFWRFLPMPNCVSDLIKLRETLDISLSRLNTPHRQNPNWHRDWLLTDTIRCWNELGASIRASVDPYTQTPGGPLIRFLIAVANAAGVSITAPAARGFIRRFRNRQAGLS